MRLWSITLGTRIKLSWQFPLVLREDSICVKTIINVVSRKCYSWKWQTNNLLFQDWGSFIKKMLLICQSFDSHFLFTIDLVQDFSSRYKIKTILSPDSYMLAQKLFWTIFQFWLKKNNNGSKSARDKSNGL